METISTPIEVVIEEERDHHGNLVWVIEPKDKPSNKSRFLQHKTEFEGKWKTRHPKKDPPDPNSSDPHKSHLPVVFKEGETLRFTCPARLRFAIGAKRSSDVDEFAGTPNNPFGWNGLQIVTAGGSVSAAVLLTAGDPGPKYQAFYKFHGWVQLADGTFKHVDPDGYCGG